MMGILLSCLYGDVDDKNRMDLFAGEKGIYGEGSKRYVCQGLFAATLSEGNSATTSDHRSHSYDTWSKYKCY